MRIRPEAILVAVAVLVAAAMPAGAQSCLPGSASPTGSSPCFLCLPGFFSATTGATACTACPPNTYADSAGATACTPCPPGTTSGGGAVACTPGTTTTSTTLPGPCNPNPCLNGGTCLATEGGQYLCICPPGVSGTNCESSSTTSTLPTTTTTTSSASTTVPTSTTLPPLCGPFPTGGCRLAAAGASTILVKDSPNDLADQLKWRWSRGAATDLADFGNPVNGTAVSALCLYDASVRVQPLLAADVPPGGTCGRRACWKAGATGFVYKDTLGAAHGVTLVKLRAGASGRASVQVNGKGPGLHPTLGLTLPVTVQLVVRDGTTTTCWQTTFGGATANDASRFSAKGP